MIFVSLIYKIQDGISVRSPLFEETLALSFVHRQFLLYPTKLQTYEVLKCLDGTAHYQYMNIQWPQKLFIQQSSLIYICYCARKDGYRDVRFSSIQSLQCPSETSCKQDLEILGQASKILLRSCKVKLHLQISVVSDKSATKILSRSLQRFYLVKSLEKILYPIILLPDLVLCIDPRFHSPNCFAH